MSEPMSLRFSCRSWAAYRCHSRISRRSPSSCSSSCRPSRSSSSWRRHSFRHTSRRPTYRCPFPAHPCSTLPPPPPLLKSCSRRSVHRYWWSAVNRVASEVAFRLITKLCTCNFSVVYPLTSSTGKSRTAIPRICNGSKIVNW